MATTTTEETSGVSQDTIAPQQPELGSNIEHDSAAKPDPKGAQHDKKEKEEAENGGASSAVQKDTTRPTLDPEWVEERFRIDRKKLESMLYGEWNDTLFFFFFWW